MNNSGGSTPQNPYGSTPQFNYPETPGQPYFTAYPPRQRINSFAVASLVLSILGGCGITAIIGIILGVKARKEIASDLSQSGDGLALTGIILGIVHLALLVIIIIFYIVLSIILPEVK